MGVRPLWRRPPGWRRTAEAVRHRSTGRVDLLPEDGADRVAQDLDGAVQLVIGDDGGWREQVGVGLDPAEQAPAGRFLVDPRPHFVAGGEALLGGPISHELDGALAGSISRVASQVPRSSRSRTGSTPSRADS